MINSFKAGHTYRIKTGGPLARDILCVSVNKRTAAFRTGDSFSIKSLDKADLYEDLGVKASFRSFMYSLLG